jgi:hypothetical protein
MRREQGGDGAGVGRNKKALSWEEKMGHHEQGVGGSWREE